MTRPIETWIALALLMIAAAGAVVALAPPLPSFLQESCSPALPGAGRVDLRVDDAVRADGPTATRTIRFAPDEWGDRVVLVTCLTEDVRVERGGTEPVVRIVVSARGSEPVEAVEDAEIKMRAVLWERTVYVVPRIELHGSIALPRLSFVLELPAGFAGHTEAWP